MMFHNLKISLRMFKPFLTESASYYSRQKDEDKHTFPVTRHKHSLPWLKQHNAGFTLYRTGHVLTAKRKKMAVTQRGMLFLMRQGLGQLNHLEWANKLSKQQSTSLEKTVLELKIVQVLEVSCSQSRMNRDKREIVS